MVKLNCKSTIRPADSTNDDVEEDAIMGEEKVAQDDAQHSEERD